MRSDDLARRPLTNAAERAYERRRRRYFALMATCLALFVGAWALVRLWSVPVAIGMCVVAMVIPPIAVIVGNKRAPDEQWWDEDEGPGGPYDPPRGFEDRR